MELIDLLFRYPNIVHVYVDGIEKVQSTIKLFNPQARLKEYGPICYSFRERMIMVNLAGMSVDLVCNLPINYVVRKYRIRLNEIVDITRIRNPIAHRISEILASLMVNTNNNVIRFGNISTFYVYYGSGIEVDYSPIMAFGVTTHTGLGKTSLIVRLLRLPANDVVATVEVFTDRVHFNVNYPNGTLILTTTGSEPLEYNEAYNVVLMCMSLPLIVARILERVLAGLENEPETVKMFE